jgi:homoserine acetyltransferase
LKNFAAGNFTLESGTELQNVEIAYHIFGELAPEKKVI